ncbi:hypothetical protein IW262DRAFT_1451228 [Armillaria fumosa]|nr:hypothetical protein IW262DRAFT_1451228 [Armillaria fumosa]
MIIGKPLISSEDNRSSRAMLVGIVFAPTSGYWRSTSSDWCVSEQIKRSRGHSILVDPSVAHPKRRFIRNSASIHGRCDCWVGSGITSTRFARTQLVGMFEARDACSGARAWNRRHITPTLYHNYHDLKKKYGAEVTKQVIQFRLSHLDEMISVAEEEGLTEESQCRKVDTYDVYFDKDMFEGAKEKLGRYLEELPRWLGY